MPYDLVLKGGDVIDPGWPFHQQADVAITKGKIAAVTPNIPATEAIRTIDVTGKIVCPGLIDIHAHTFINAHDMGPETDQRCAASGVTTIIDAGSAGSATFPGLRHYVAERSQVRLRCFVHLSALGLIHLQVGELMNLDYADPEGCARTIRDNRDIAIGVKLRFSNNVVPDKAGTEPLRLARQAADMAEVPLMVHITDALLPVPKILEFMKPGDVVTHCLHRYPYGIMGPEKKEILREVWNAQKAGVIFDCAHGRMHFTFPFVRMALEQGFMPDTIATDLSIPSATRGPVFDLPTTMSKFLNLGMSLEDVIRRVTTNSARAIGEGGVLGTLKPGSVADVAVFSLERGQFDFVDTDQNHMIGEQRLVTQLTLKDGRVWYRAPREQ
ncbi:MAG: amidohydrolase/deacetylase family metallohydrolase [Deltaproteobacteria bacterium]|nr:amidohydrolase/deacetylase family metallohydrolase [Deltaproteobacteria bacterium]